MIQKTFKIIYELNSETHNIECSEYYLHEYIDKILENGSNVMSIYAKDTKSKKQQDINKIEKNKYYNSKYNYYYKQYKSNKIDIVTFNKVRDVLKNLRNESSNLKEFSNKFVKFENLKER